MGCRRVALLALKGRKKCRALLDAGGTHAVLELLRRRGERRAQTKEETLWVLGHPQLLRYALNALLIEAAHNLIFIHPPT